MNPLEGFIIVFSGILLVVLLSLFINDVRNLGTVVSDRQDLINVINIYNRGVYINASFSIIYTPLRAGFINITPDFIYLNNASAGNPGMNLVSCGYDKLIISEEGVSCLKLQ